MGGRVGVRIVANFSIFKSFEILFFIKENVLIVWFMSFVQIAPAQMLEQPSQAWAALPGGRRTAG